MEKWIVRTKRADFDKIAQKFQIDPVTARIIRNRDVIGDDQIQKYLYGGWKDLYDPHLLHQGEDAAKLLADLIRAEKKIRVIGDYDIDGVTSTYILRRGIERCNGLADHVIPHRIVDGYGVNEQLITQAHQDGVDVIVTCDNGISAFGALQLAKEYGMTVIVTDHHEVPFSYQEDGSKEVLRSEADAIVNPKQPECEYPFKGLCGAAVAFKFVQLLYMQFQLSIEETKEYLPYVAIGTIGDVMELVDENRIFVKLGLSMLQEGADVSLMALIRQCKLEPQDVNVYKIGFVIGPCMNASGRLDTAETTLELLLTKTEARATLLAAKLVELNEERKNLTEHFLNKAIEEIDIHGWDQDKVMVVYLPDCHESIAGIIAGRLRERYFRPAIVLTKGEEFVKGSGRSIEGYSMFDEMVKVSDLFLKFGGHPLAAGCSLLEENVDLLREKLNQLCTLTKDDFVSKVYIDLPMPMDYVTKELIEEFKILEPIGNGNKMPLFAQKDVIVQKATVIGKNQNTIKFELLTPNQNAVVGILFKGVDQFFQHIKEQYGEEELRLLKSGKSKNVKLSFTFYPMINYYNGNTTIQMNIQNYC